MVDDQGWLTEKKLWLCVVCEHGHPVRPPEISLADNYGTGQCDNLDCPSRKDKGTKKRRPMLATFRRVHARQEGSAQSA